MHKSVVFITEKTLIFAKKFIFLQKNRFLHHK